MNRESACVAAWEIAAASLNTTIITEAFNHSQVFLCRTNNNSKRLMTVDLQSRKQYISLFLDDYFSVNTSEDLWRLWSVTDGESLELCIR